MSLAKVNTVKSRQNYTCEKCQMPIEKGQMYRWFKVGFRPRYKHVRCMKTECAPRDSERESSKLADVYGALEDASFQVGMASSIEDLQAALEECASQINDVASEYSDAAYAMGEGAGYEMQEKADLLEQTADELANVEFEETPMVECDECGGSGTEECYECDGSGMFDEDEECEECGASGEIGDCPECGGNGEVEGEPDMEAARELAQDAIHNFEMPAMTIDELIAALTEIKENNREPEIPNFDPGTMEVQVQVQSEDGTYDSNIVSVEEANGPWLIVNKPNYDL